MGSRKPLSSRSRLADLEARVHQLEDASWHRSKLEFETIWIMTVLSVLIVGAVVLVVISAEPPGSVRGGVMTDLTLARAVALAVLVGLVSAFGTSSFIASFHPFFDRRFVLEEAGIVGIMAVFTVTPLILASQLIVAGRITGSAIAAGLATAALATIFVAFFSWSVRAAEDDANFPEVISEITHP